MSATSAFGQVSGFSVDHEPKPKPPEPGPLLTAALGGPLSGCEEIVFAERVSGRDHWYGNFGHYCETTSHYTNAALTIEGDMRYAFADGGRLCRLNLRTRELAVLLDDPQGGIRDPHLHYDGQKILFSYRKGGTKAFHLYEIGVDGSNLTQLTDGPDNDIEPIYTPDGAIVFCSSRCHRYVPCWRTQVATLYRCDADGGNIRMLSNNAEQENTPWMLPDGRVLYMRWEYVDRNQLLYHHLWTVNPDGTSVMVYFGNQHPGLVMIDAKPIPGTGKVVASFSPGHGVVEHMGEITIVDPRNGPDDMSMARSLSKKRFRDPYPLSEDLFLVADNAGIHLLGSDGSTELLYANKGLQCHEPRPLRAREREALVVDRFAAPEATGTLVLSDIYHGRNMAGVERGSVRKLLILEQLPKPANFSGGQEPLTIGGTFTLQRILGTVPVEADGSACMEVPALRSVFFLALDENDLAVKRMQSFVTVQPGETTSCVGCHEHRTQAPHARNANTLAALRRPPSTIEAYTDFPDILDFPRDIQPILDRHCVACHNHDQSDGEINLSGDRTPLYSTAYWTMFSKGLAIDGRNKHGNQPPRALGSAASPLMTCLDVTHHDVALSSREVAMVRLWIDSGATYSGTYAALGSGMHPVDFPEETIIHRCGQCHEAKEKTYRNFKKGAYYFQFGQQKPPQPLLKSIDDIILIRHLAYFQLGEAPLYQALCNLDRPEHSIILRAPLAKSAGGLGLCGDTVFADTQDPGYREVLTAIEAAAVQLVEKTRFDMPGFRPNRFYIREMQLFGILPEDLPQDAPIDVYAADQRYWRSFVYQP
jgi:Hydrazine synthase alpha subunit middle domain/WD40-like Beta Propeller Repeat